MIVTLIQMDIQWGDVAGNCDVASRLIDQAPQSDLYILPEMFSTGFATEPQNVADGSQESLTWMLGKAHEKDAAICGSVATQCEDGTFRNRLYFVKPDGEVAYYDKHHLFTYGGENKSYTAGQERVIVEWRGVRFLLQCCYDLRFPCFSRNGQGGQVYDAVIYVASWPTSRIQAWRSLLFARAIENQCYVCGVNRIGSDPRCQYSGGTALIDPRGYLVDACPDKLECYVTGEFEMDELRFFRQKFPVLEDRDTI